MTTTEAKTTTIGGIAVGQHEPIAVNGKVYGSLHQVFKAAGDMRSLLAETKSQLESADKMLDTSRKDAAAEKAAHGIEVGKLKAELEKARGEAARFQRETQKAREGLAESEAGRKQLSATIASMSDRHDEMKAEVEKLKAELAEMGKIVAAGLAEEGDIETLQEELRQERARSSALTTELADLKTHGPARPTGQPWPPDEWPDRLAELESAVLRLTNRMARYDQMFSSVVQP